MPNNITETQRMPKTKTDIMRNLLISITNLFCSQFKIISKDVVLKKTFFKAVVAMVLLLVGRVEAGWGQTNISAGGTYTQNFDALSTTSSSWTDNSTLSGWYVSTSTLPIQTGSTNSNSAYNCGVLGTNALSDRAIGALSTGTTHRLGLRLKNNGASNITSFSISFNGEQWRAFNAGTLTFDYQAGASVSSLTTGTWTAFTSLDFASLTTSASPGSATDGNNANFRTAKTATLSVTVAANTEIFFRWTKAGTSSACLAIDDLNITATAAVATPTISTTGTLSSVNTTYGTATATPGIFSVSGANMSAGITVTPPAGFEVSTASDFSSNTGTNGSPITVGASGTIAATNVYVRLLATAAVASSPFSGNIVLASTSASSVNVATVSSTVSAKELTITGLTGANKPYDGNTDATFTGTAAYSGLANGESAPVTGTPTASFANATVANGKTITVAGYTAPSANYTVTQPSLSGNITPVALTITAGNQTVTYGTAAATVTGAGSYVASGFVNGETASVIGGLATYTTNYTNTTGAASSAITITPVVIGLTATNYSLTPANGTITIIKTNSSITASGTTSFVYDGLPHGPIGSTVSGSSGAVSFSYSGTLSTTYAASPTAPSEVGTYQVIATVEADANYNWASSAALAFSITDGPVPEISSVLVASATYGVAASVYTITGTNSPNSYLASGLPAGLSVNAVTGDITGTATVAPGSYNVTIGATTNGGTGIATLVYIIWAKPLTLPNAAATTKVYDRTNAAVLTGTLTGKVGTDDVSLNGTGTFSQSGIGTGLTVTSTSTLVGTKAAYYTLTQPTGLTAGITAKGLTVSGATVSSRAYNGLASATITGATLVGVVSPDVVTVSGTGTFADVNAANGISVTAALSLGGAAAGNYTLTQPSLSGNITKAILTINGLSGVNKPYDGLTTASFTGTAAYAGLQNGESFPVSGTPSAAFSTATAANGKTITVSGYAAPSGNYSVTSPNITGNITTIALTITGLSGVNKAYTGTNSATLSGTAAYSGLVNSESFTVTGTPVAIFVSVNVGTGIGITVTSYTAPSANYTVTQPTGLTADITKANQIITFAATATSTITTPNYDPGATSATSSTNAITYVCDNAAVATIVSNQIHIVGIGTAIITASQAASANYNAAPDVTQTLTVTLNTDVYRTKASGNWNTEGTWENATTTAGPWATATATPGANNSVYIQSGHTVTLTQNESVNDLNIASGTAATLTASVKGLVGISTFTLSVNGKLRDYYGAVGIVPGTNQNGGFSAYPFTAGSGGKVSIVGNSRTVFTSGEWGATITTALPNFPLEINMNVGQIATATSSIKCSNLNVVSGTLEAVIIGLDNGTVGQGDATIASGATIISSANSPSNVFQKTGAALAGTLAVNGTLVLTGATPLISMTTIAFNGTVEYSKNGLQTLAVLTNGGASPNTYTNLKLSGSNVKTLGVATTVNGTLTLAGTALLALNAKTLTYGGSSTLEYAGSAAQTTSTAAELSVLPPTVKINNALGVSLGQTVSLSALDLTSGIVSTGANALTIGATGSVANASASSYVNGNLNKFIAASSTTKNFEIGDASVYAPISLDFAGTISNSTGTIQISTASGDHASISSSNIIAAKSVNRTWTITNAVALSGLTSYNPTFTFVSSDLDASTTTSGFIVGNFGGSSWSHPTVGVKTSTSTQATGVTSYGSFAIGEVKATPTIIPAVGNYTYSGTSQGPNSVSTTSSGSVTYTYVGVSPTIYSESATPPINAGSYTVTATVVADANYVSASSSATAFTIGMAALTITANNQSKCSGTSFTFAGNEFTNGTLMSGDAVSSVTLTSSGSSSSALSNAYSIVPSAALGTGLSNYTISYVNGTFTVTSNSWTGGNGNWNDAANWSCGIIPSTGSSIVISSGTPLLDVDFNLAGGLTISGTGGLTINPLKTLTISGSADFAGNLVTVKSNATGSGSIGKITGTLSNASNVTVERFIPNNGFRSWRLLSVPTYGSQTINGAWQEGNLPLVNNNPGYGTQITGSSTSLGFDDLSPYPSMLTFNGVSFAGIPNTSIPISSNKAYFIYVRGDRTSGVNVSTTSNSTTTLRTTGSIYQGTQTTSNIPANSYALIGNPFASTIDFTGIARNGGVKDAFYIWDSKINSGSSLGVYQTFSGTNAYLCPLPNGSFNQGQKNTSIQSGQAFFVENGPTTGSVSIPESSKVVSSASTGFKLPGQLVKIDSRLYSLRSADTTMADANVVVFDTAYSNEVDLEDASKFSNTGENLGILRHSETLVIEGRKPITISDTLFFKISNMHAHAYQLEFVPQNLGAQNLTARLEDSYLNTSTAVDLSGNTLVNFTVNATTASYASNRFRIVFAPAVVLPVNFQSISASRKASNALVNWKVSNEINIRIYEVERSTNGSKYDVVGIVSANAASAYHFTDLNLPSSNLFYRVKSIGAAGDMKYSTVVNLESESSKPSFAVVPNSVEGAVMNIQFGNQPKGLYQLRLINTVGQQVTSMMVSHPGGFGTITVSVPSDMAKGTYQLEIVAPDNTISVQKVVVIATY